ncbi:DUF1772 domain-containing protein [Rhizobium laguerreae]|uniref:anthrone oxygenase family protein n=1 Tax=Rhizobium laguerreae TaxID=1076926 RepID=UPI001441B692|nr:anthrone oxygenase family protein [Rhizobium laguerreae]MBY3086852.1 DUF1772 domain-containing protein [Rhizobium laguerreae]MBY3147260.1 DUF1772 domain-containing protein [Rhizobium laguerreae]MBY3274676.1 DUF1772 domain-containing protein [Rhizobium laguerreae]MBY3466016.1 DUF1772 domain-containing protein [Rhizobium laguerreae]NKM22388.1 DUF1772 domain-containing protein [Rhizobium laguerreae]
MRSTVLGLSVTSVVFSGAIFGFFYAWVCSTMWGLDRADPRVAIAAMQAMNASVRNAVFFPAFFLTPVVLGLTVAAAHFSGREAAAFWFGAAAAVYLVFGLMLTFTVNVPMNEALAARAVPDDVAAARDIWRDYSPRWQIWNQARALASGIALALAALGVARL